MTPQWLEADWPAPPGIRAVTTLRSGGISRGCYSSMNLGAHVGDRLEHVHQNRQSLAAALGLRHEPNWLNQVHGIDVIDAADAQGAEGDAVWTDQLDSVCAVMTADCLPLLLCNDVGNKVAAVHAGWRGLHAGVIESAVATLRPDRLMAWLGPAIGPNAFEVGAEVRASFLQRWSGAETAFRPNNNGRWLADIYALAKLALHGCGVRHIYGGGSCTYSDADRFFFLPSRRRHWPDGHAHLASIVESLKLCH